MTTDTANRISFACYAGMAVLWLLALIADPSFVNGFIVWLLVNLAYLSLKRGNS